MSSRQLLLAAVILAAVATIAGLVVRGREQQLS